MSASSDINARIREWAGRGQRRDPSEDPSRPGTADGGAGRDQVDDVAAPDMNEVLRDAVRGRDPW